MKRPTALLERIFERALWASRLVMLIAVVVSVLLALGTLYLGIVDAIRVFGLLKDYAAPSLGPQGYTELRNEAVTTIVRTLDAFLIASILFVFAFGIYGLFISELDVSDQSRARLRFLIVDGVMT